MEIGEIWISIIIPLILGPLFVFFKTLWDRSNNFKEKKRQLLFDDTRNRLKNQLDDFYYPVYLKLLLLYSISFILPEKDVDTITESISSSESEYCSSDEEYNNNTKLTETCKNISYKKRRCMAYYKINEEYVKCRNIIPNSGFSKICKCCRWKFLSGKIEINILDQKDIEPNSVFYVPITEELQDKRKIVIDKTETIRKRIRRSSDTNVIKDITIQIPDFTDISELEESKEESILNQMNLLSISISEKTIPIIEHVCNSYYKQIAESIESNIHIIEPNTRLTKHLILFLKYAKIRDLIHENNLCEEDCKPEDFGAKNNINTLVGHIEANLNKYGNQYKKLMEKGYI
jgi:hypothetical protein